MAVVEPGKGRAIINNDDAGLRIIVPAEIRILPLAFIAVWSFIWVGGGISIFVRLWRDGLNAEPFGLAWPLIWVFGCGWMLYSLLWTFTGREIIELRSTTLNYCRQTWLIRQRREYAVANISNLRATALSYADLYSPRVMPFASFDRCAVSFDYGGATHRVAMSLREADAKHLIGEMCKRVKSLCG